MRFYGLEHYRDWGGGPIAINVSGGRSSGLQAWHFREAHPGELKDVVFNFENTGLEHNNTYTFLRRLDEHLGLNLVLLEYDPAAPNKYRRVSHDTLSRNGEPFQRLLSEIIPKRRDGTTGVRPLPNPTQRVCTAQMKVKTLHRYVRNELGWPTTYKAAIGYRADEKSRYEHRIKVDAKRRPEGGYAWCPMYHSGVIAQDTLDFFGAGLTPEQRALSDTCAPFDLELDGLFGNCDLCLMTGAWKILERMAMIAAEDGIVPEVDGLIPVRVARWIAWEERDCDRPGVFRKDRPTYRAMWHKVCIGDFSLAGMSAKAIGCGSCTD